MQLEKRITFIQEPKLDQLKELSEKIKTALAKGEGFVTRVPYVKEEKQFEVPLEEDLESEFKNKRNMNYFDVAERKQQNSIAIMIGSEAHNPASLLYWSKGTKQVYLQAWNLTDVTSMAVQQVFGSYKSTPLRSRKNPKLEF